MPYFLMSPFVLAACSFAAAADLVTDHPGVPFCIFVGILAVGNGIKKSIHEALANEREKTREEA